MRVCKKCWVMRELFLYIWTVWLLARRIEWLLKGARGICRKGALRRNATLDGKKQPKQADV
jgi:hypothetical protein